MELLEHLGAVISPQRGQHSATRCHQRLVSLRRWHVLRHGVVVSRRLLLHQFNRSVDARLQSREMVAQVVASGGGIEHGR